MPGKQEQEQEAGIHPVLGHQSTTGRHAYTYSTTHLCLGKFSITISPIRMILGGEEKTREMKKKP